MSIGKRIPFSNLSDDDNSDLLLCEISHKLRRKSHSIVVPNCRVCYGLRFLAIESETSMVKASSSLDLVDFGLGPDTRLGVVNNLDKKLLVSTMHDDAVPHGPHLGLPRTRDQALK